MRISDVSSDVCSSDLPRLQQRPIGSDPRLTSGARHHVLCRHASAAFAPVQEIAGAAGGGERLSRPLFAGGACDLRLDDRRAARHLVRSGLVGRAAMVLGCGDAADAVRSEEHTSELPSLMRISYAVFCLKKKNNHHTVY